MNVQELRSTTVWFVDQEDSSKIPLAWRPALSRAHSTILIHTNAWAVTRIALNAVAPLPITAQHVLQEPSSCFNGSQKSTLKAHVRYFARMVSTAMQH